MVTVSGPGKVICPRCKKVHFVEVGVSDVECNCHRFCDDGVTPEDCNLIYQTPTPQNPVTASFPHGAGFPEGQHNFSADYGDDKWHRTNYCTVHKKYTYKTPILIPFDWTLWQERRAERKFRQVYQTTGI